MAYLHHASAKEGHNNHECPARNDGENPQKVTEWYGNLVLSERSVKRMEIAGISRLLLPLFRGAEFIEGLGSCRGGVQVPSVDINGCWRG